VRGRLLARMGEMGYVARAVLTGRLCPRRIADKAENRSGFESGGHLHGLVSLGCTMSGFIVQG